DTRRKQITRGGSLHRLGRCEAVDAFAEGAVADLIVILDEIDKGGGRQMHARFPARRPATITRDVVLEREAFGQTASQMGERFVGVVLVVAVALGREQHMKGVMAVVVPLRRGDQRFVFRTATEQTRLVLLV